LDKGVSLTAQIVQILSSEKPDLVNALLMAQLLGHETGYAEKEDAGAAERLRPCSRNQPG
jgi:hypothetical protein